MSKKEVVEDKTTGELDLSKAYEGREFYATGFRNIDTIIGSRIYDTVSNELLKTNRGILSGSWVSFIGVSHSGKSTLCTQIAANELRPWINDNSFDPRVKLYILDVENGVNRSRFKKLTKLTDTQIARHVTWVENPSINTLGELITNILKEKESPAYKPIRKEGYQGKVVDIYPPTVIIIDAISELITDDAMDLNNDISNTMHMRQNLNLDQFVKKYNSKFVKYNINILAVAHISNKINVDNPMARPSREFKGLPANVKINGGKAIQYASDLIIYINKIEAADDSAVEKKGAKSLGASSIMSAVLVKNRQGLDNESFYLVFDNHGQFDPLSSFIYECQQTKLLVAAGPTRKIAGTDISCRSQDVIDKILTDAEFRTALFNAYDESKKEALDSTRVTAEEAMRHNDILDVMML